MAFEDIQILLTEESQYRVYYPNPIYSDIQLTIPIDTLQTKNYYLKQYGNFYLMQEVTTNNWVSPNKININPKNNVEIQLLLDLYSGLAGKTTFTAQELKTLASGSSGKIVLVFAESVISGIAAADYQTNLAKITTNTGKIIWSFKII